MSATISYDDFEATKPGETKPSQQQLNDGIRAVLEPGEPLTLTVTKPLEVSGGGGESAAPGAADQDYVIPFKLDIKVFSYEGEFKVKLGDKWSATVTVTVTVVGMISRTLRTEINYARAEHCQRLDLGTFAGTDLCVGMKMPRFCAYIKGKAWAIGQEAKFDETIKCIKS
ncbi:MAG TPA: hypothetical protein VHS78_10475 [Candidatus Elarobacter sp.]|jgi:hypothetical protein|nr:hypothetical protein [Candidatus Elarobacter sp.]